MTASTLSALPFAAAVLATALAVLSPIRKKPSLATWCFFAGMLILAADSLFSGFALRSGTVDGVVRWLTIGLVTKSLLPAAWLPFSLTYSRGDARQSLRRWKVPFPVLALLPIALSLGFHDELLGIQVLAGPAGGLLQLRFAPVAKALNVLLIVAFVVVLMNLEQTFRSAVGTMRWRIKYVILGSAAIFGAHVYVRSQALLFSAHDIALSGVESSGLLVGCLLLALAYARTGLAEIDAYPSRAVLRSSLTVIIVGSYLLVVGVLAQVARRFGGAGSLQFQALVVLVGMAGLAVLLLSDRLRQRVRAFVGRHFGKAQHDSVRLWSEFSRRLADVRDQAGLSNAASRLISDAFEVLSVTVWVRDEEKEQFGAAASTGAEKQASDGDKLSIPAGDVAAALRENDAPFDLEEATGSWAEELRRANPTRFPNGGHRLCLPLKAGERVAGAIVLADRVNGARYSIEELELLRCIGDQVTSALLNLRLADEVARARELEAFRTMSAFFVHDLKNAASSLNLMLKNLPAHFDDPAFREDALRGVGNAARRIDDTILRLTALRQRPDLKPVEADLNVLVKEAVEGIGDFAGAELEMETELRPLPRIRADCDQIRSVVANLVLNARDAVSIAGAVATGGARAVAAPALAGTSADVADKRGRIVVSTEHAGGRAVVSVADNGCGMSPTFLKESLFRPFQSTKKKGLGIGMFQSRAIVEAHGGSIQVESEPGRGTTVRVSLPVEAVK